MSMLEVAKAYADAYLSDDTPEKATLFIYDKGEGAEPTKLVAQFNPSEYTISRSVKTQDATPAGQETNPDDTQVTGAPLGVLSLTLYFDAYSDLEDLSLKKMAKNAMNAGGAMMGAVGTLTEVLNGIQPKANGEVAERCQEIATSLKFAASIHAPPPVMFVWGTMAFMGVVISSTINYTMFNPNGAAVRMKVTLEIKGEEQGVSSESESKPFESPDRTKERFLHQGDQLWMVAADEYGDPEQWKVIARANGILNPRALGGKGMSLKVPSIR